MKLLLLMPFGCSLEGSWHDFINIWAAKHDFDVEVYHDKTETWERIAALAPGSIFVGELWDFSLNGYWTTREIGEIVQKLIESVPEHVGVLLFDTFLVNPSPRDIMEVLRFALGSRVSIYDGGLDDAMANLDAILASLQP